MSGVVCRSTAKAKAECRLLFPAGSYKIQGKAAQASYRLTRGGRRYLSGRLRVQRGDPIRLGLPVRGLRSGSYTLTITIGHSRRTLLRMAVRIS
jgi:hypothetical protein